jgi:hypothetical protein
VRLFCADGAAMEGDVYVFLKVCGTRKSRYSGREAPAAVTLLKALDE